MNLAIREALLNHSRKRDGCVLNPTAQVFQQSNSRMDPDFSNYLSSQKSFLAISEVSSISPLTMMAQHLKDTHQQDTDFYDIYNYTSNVMTSWGLNLGLMVPSSDNTKTVQCIMELIRLRQKDQEYREKVKDDIAKMEFEKSLIKNNLSKATDEANEYKRKLGQLENRFREEESKLKKETKSVTSERQELLQVNKKLEQKNTQLVHEMKKRETEFQRTRDSMKRPSDKTQPRNSFELISALTFSEGDQSSKYTILKEKHENERGYYVQENLSLKQQLQDAEEIINNFIRFLKDNCQVKALQQLNLNPQQHIEYNQGKLLSRLSETIDSIKTNILNFMQQPSKARMSAPLMSKPSRKSILDVAPKMTQSVSARHPPRVCEQELEQCGGLVKEDISIISYVSVKDIEMPMKGKASYDKWDILYDNRL